MAHPLIRAFLGFIAIAYFIFVFLATLCEGGDCINFIHCYNPGSQHRSWTRVGVQQILCNNHQMKEMSSERWGDPLVQSSFHYTHCLLLCHGIFWGYLSPQKLLSFLDLNCLLTIYCSPLALPITFSCRLHTWFSLQLHHKLSKDRDNVKILYIPSPAQVCIFIQQISTESPCFLDTARAIGVNQTDDILCPNWAYGLAVRETLIK